MATVYLSGAGLGPQAGFQPAAQVPVFGNLNDVAALTVDASNNVYVAESETYPGYPGAPEIPGGIFKATSIGNGKFTQNDIGGSLVDPVGVAVDGDGNVLEADAILDPWISPRQGTDGAMPASFHEEQSLAVDAQGNIYSAGYGSVYKSSPAFASDQSYSTIVSGLGTVRSIAVDGQGNVYVPDSGQKPAVYKFIPTENGEYIKTLLGTGWSQPVGIAVDGNGIVYVNDSGTIYAETRQPNGHYLRTALLTSQNNGTSPAGLAVDGSGNLYVPIYAGQGEFGASFNVDKFDRTSPPALSFATTAAGSTSSDSPRTVTISNLGNQPLRFSSIQYPGNFPENVKGIGRCTAATTLAPGASCEIAVDFAPVTDPAGGETEEAVASGIRIVTNTLNAPATVQTIPVLGVKTRMPIVEKPVIFQPSGTYTASQPLVLSDATPGAVIYYTLNGETPTETSGIRYTGPRTIDASVTLKAVAYAPGHAPSPAAAATYRLLAAKPVISPPGGKFSAPVTVTIAGSTPGAVIFYTTDGTLPTTSSKVYTGPFKVSANRHVRAIAACTGFTTSSPVLQIFSVAAPAN
jgi:hypothetical protein